LVHIVDWQPLLVDCAATLRAIFTHMLGLLLHDCLTLCNCYVVVRAGVHLLEAHCKQWLGALVAEVQAGAAH
jgi:hypothetical protein